MKKTIIAMSLVLALGITGCGSSAAKPTVTQNDKTTSSAAKEAGKKTDSSVASKTTEKPEEKKTDSVSDPNAALKKELKEKYDITEPEKFAKGDVTGNWRIVKVSNSTPPADYAFDYAKCYMTQENNGVHFIVNFALKTTTELTFTADILDVITTEYVNGEEHDAKAIGSGMVLTERHFDMKTGAEITTDVDEEAGTVDGDMLVADVRTAIEGAVGQGEKITDVSFDGSNLTVFVDMSGAAGGSVPVEMIAETRVSSITDEILALDDSHYNTWETVTVDFGDIGSVVCDKSMVKDEGYGKYFEIPMGIFGN